MKAASKFLKERELCSSMRKEVEEYFGVIWQLHKYAICSCIFSSFQESLSAIFDY